MAYNILLMVSPVWDVADFTILPGSEAHFS
jgi:hypothetical protein